MTVEVFKKAEAEHVGSSLKEFPWKYKHTRHQQIRSYVDLSFAYDQGANSSLNYVWNSSPTLLAAEMFLSGKRYFTKSRLVPRLVFGNFRM